MGDLRLYFPAIPNRSEFIEFWFDEPKIQSMNTWRRDHYSCRVRFGSARGRSSDASENQAGLVLGDFEMTPKGTFVVVRTERGRFAVILPGVYFEAELDRTTGRQMASAKLIPDRGAWMEFETRKNDSISLKYNRRRTVPITVFLRAMAAIDDGIPDSPLTSGTDEEILALFQDVDNNPDHSFIESSSKKNLSMI